MDTCQHASGWKAECLDLVTWYRWGNLRVTEPYFIVLPALHHRQHERRGGEREKDSPGRAGSPGLGRGLLSQDRTQAEALHKGHTYSPVQGPQPGRQTATPILVRDSGPLPGQVLQRLGAAVSVGAPILHARHAATSRLSGCAGSRLAGGVERLHGPSTHAGVGLPVSKIPLVHGTHSRTAWGWGGMGSCGWRWREVGYRPGECPSQS